MACTTKSTCSCEQQKYLGNQSDGDGGGFRIQTPWQLRYEHQTGAPVTFLSKDKNANVLGPIQKLGTQTSTTYPCTPLQPGADPNTRIRKSKFVPRKENLLDDLVQGNVPSAPGVQPPVGIRNAPAHSLAPTSLVPGVQPIAPPTHGFYFF